MEVKKDKEFRAPSNACAPRRDQKPMLPNACKPNCARTRKTAMPGPCAWPQPASAACWPTTWAWARPCRRWRCCWRAARDGPALVVAPTSVCGNWLAEAAALRAEPARAVYGEGDRDAAARPRPAPCDVVVVSYALLQQAASASPDAPGTPLVARRGAGDQERQPPSAAQAVFELQADFRLALSGTPIENRLAELWSIMRFCNPGLLGTLRSFNERFASPIEREPRPRARSARCAG